MAKQKSNNKFHAKLKELLESIKPCIIANTNDDDIKILIRNFMDEQFRLCHDYFQFHLDEAKAVATEYQTELAYIIDLINASAPNAIDLMLTSSFMYYSDNYYTNKTYCDEYYWYYDVCSNIESFNLMFGFISHLNMEHPLKGIDHDWSPIFKTQPKHNNKPNEIIETDADPVFTEKLINLLNSIKTWNTNVCNYDTEKKLIRSVEKFMDDLWPLYLDYFQYHIEEVRIAATNHHELLSNNIAIIQEWYVDEKFDYVERTTSNEYLDPPWVEACKIRSRIEAFNDMFGFLETLNNKDFADWLVGYQGEASFADEICDAPKKHWWWAFTKRAHDDFIRAIWEDNHSTKNNAEIIFLDQFRKKH